MAQMLIAAVLGFFAVAAPAATGEKVTPVQKVVMMMQEMKAQSLREKKDEEVTFSAFSSWCQSTNTAKNEDVKAGNAKIEQLGAAIEKHDSDAKVLGEEILKLDSLTDQAEQDEKSATKVRQEEHALYLETHAELVSSIEDMDNGIQQVKQMEATAPSLVQQAAHDTITRVAARPSLPPNARRVLAAFLATGASGVDVTAPEASNFETQSGGIVDLVVDLQGKLRDEKKQLETEEFNAVNALQMVLQSLKNQIDGHAATRSRKVGAKKAAEAAAAEAKGDLAMETATKKADAKFLLDLKMSCEQKTKDFESRQKLRSEELEAMDKAMEILMGSAVSGAADRQLPALVQASSKPRAFAQLRNSVSHASQSAAAAYLEMQSHKLHSRMLAQLSAKVSEDPFTKVKKMIQGMILKLQEEANDEAEHKGWCDTEMSTNQQTRESKTVLVDELTASVQELKAKSAKLTNDVSKLSAQAAELDSAVAKATEIREQEKEKNASTLADARGAIVAVEKATAVLKDFYAKAAGATALSQVGGVEDEMPATFDKPYRGAGGEGGILGMLEVILSDFQRLEAVTTENEAVSAREYESFMNDSAEEKAVTAQTVTNHKNMIVQLNSQLGESKNDLASAQEELSAATAYYAKLKPSCVDAGVSYQERVANRQEEIESLQDALKILAGEDIA